MASALGLTALAIASGVIIWLNIKFPPDPPPAGFEDVWFSP